MRCLTLIGMPGSGKSAVGRIIAARLGWEMIDTDKAIEQHHGMPLQSVVEEIGEETFRRMEEEIILNLPLACPMIISTGGSVVYSGAAMERLRAISTVIFLDVPVEALRERIQSEAPRGIVGMTEGGLELLYQEREPLYRRYADTVITIGSETAQEVATKILTELNQELQTE